MCIVRFAPGSGSGAGTFSIEATLAAHSHRRSATPPNASRPSSRGPGAHPSTPPMSVNDTNFVATNYGPVPISAFSPMASTTASPPLGSRHSFQHQVSIDTTGGGHTRWAPTVSQCSPPRHQQQQQQQPSSVGGQHRGGASQPYNTLARGGTGAAQGAGVAAGLGGPRSRLQSAASDPATKSTSGSFSAKAVHHQV